MKNITENIDFAEKSKFNSLASEWWDADGELQTLHDINPTRLAYIEDHVDLTEKKILDVGCGGGLLSEALASKGGLVTGIDISEHLLEVAEEHSQQAGLDISYVCTTVEEFSTEHENFFDIVTCMELLEHVPDPQSVINACMHLLKPGGLLFLSTINRNLKAYLQTKIAAEYILKLLPAGTHEYAKYIRPSELASWCRASGFTVVDISGISYLPFIRQCHLKDSPDVNYILCAQADEWADEQTSDMISKPGKG
ncbi:MAG: bifunctional 3-demethylubiquinol 3-O-methyltransferase/2-polyprenyl-6-hydroxyphenol methylase [Gammaproteobacteria bacterium]|nr:MAG: bifunctional 3-demethylubiquinol 3-O-methyltransferase/2-polyprenyl-6-hydroxyphenol methylase [Gammaproteobacteria bacterium]RKZ71330.1 MAG: bifunctional 3-demethylubiquinol 3-O-methyltransferase/2-polyprenyl-6-hydroxyphenol methylase [Gammaproteobacteria bacterium]RLA13581.1 MAG: bifunctional 3-demethylubiquinol 3-O-methyltransferase/2-polyprenyl-6-hydroxyphenol methylase [Gammaproteobacteria bacterium]